MRAATKLQYSYVVRKMLFGRGILINPISDYHVGLTSWHDAEANLNKTVFVDVESFVC